MCFYVSENVRNPQMDIWTFMDGCLVSSSNFIGVGVGVRVGVVCVCVCVCVCVWGGGGGGVQYIWSSLIMKFEW